MTATSSSSHAFYILCYSLPFFSIDFFHSFSAAMVDITLFCLYNGATVSNTFPISISTTATVGELKDVIKAKNSDDFKDVAAHKLTLWKVSIPVVAADRNKSIVLSEIDSKTELLPTEELSDVVEDQLPKKTIHILLERPPGMFSSPNLTFFLFVMTVI
jgi:hypothetical protein